VIDSVLRSNPSYELLLLDDLSSAERQLVADAGHGFDAYGYLRPRPGSGLPWRSVSPDVALLLFTVATPRRMPAYLHRLLGNATVPTVQRLILDAVLEVERDGCFVSGSRSVEAAHSDHREPGRLGQQSIAALQYAQTLEGLAVQELAMRLYSYGRKPLSPSWQARLPNEDAIEDFLDLGPRGLVRPLLDDMWTEAHTPGIRFWRMWIPRGSTGDTDAAVYKLYVSPCCDALPLALHATARALSRVPGALGFKIGRGLHGLSRPDKLVAYFSRLDSLQLAAAELRGALQGSAPHGVPFTAEITRDGMLSWGIDPSARQRMADGGSEASWRAWIAGKLAEYLLIAKAQSDTQDGWRFALNRLRLDGIDTDTWVPSSALRAESAVENTHAH
jgi:hypothetical protein